ncbi:Lipid A export ATP-binding/permease protein MsbA [Nitrospira sp. KM1]|uniref:lipid A export permease/ATP-binding protein MsbA n=1 Tax=Nitrospira sp. KM1 TaxID=1936990 RepID=UPI0013A7B0CE|nr:lipid A export permease/ATP-binding protein MsbA [Nitrospira sp. KM1]BCA54250.1 Lipid A export ATP-binding/permease protein MsbA [Nitrospira sp. KM1]
MSGLDRFIRLVRYLKPYRLRLAAAFVCSALVAVFSGAYAWLVKPVLDEIFINKNEGLLVILPLALFIVSVLKSAFNYGQNYLMNFVGNQVIADIRQELFGKLIRLPVGYHDANTSGRLVSRVVNDVTLMANAVAGVLKDIFQQGLTFLAMLGVIVYQNWQLAGLSIIVIPLAVVTMVRMGKRLRALATSGQERMGDMASTLQETLAGIRMVKAYGREEAEAERFKRSNKAFLNTTMKAIQVSSLGSSHMEVIGVLGIAGIIWYGGFLVIKDAMTPGAFFSFLTAMFMAYTPLRKLSGSNNTIQQALAAAERVFGVIDLKSEQEQERGQLTLPPISRSVTYQDVTFHYEGQSVPALADIDLTIRAGEMVAIVGSSGSGKTTLVNLLPRFYEPTAGRILIDGIDIQSYTLQSLRSQIGIVSQEVVLFDDSIRNNIAFGRRNATDEQIIQAARQAYAHDFVDRLPQRYDTVIGEKGVKLSGGERQRLAIARAILRDPPLLILDEATSALDTESERVVQLALGNLMQNRTTVVIAHRLSTIQRAHRIIVFDRGSIVEIGTHEELLLRGGVYKRLHAMQFQDMPNG